MLQAFTRYAGILQALLGVIGATAPGVAPLGAGTGGSIFNILSGAALSYLGFKGTANQQRTGALGIGTVNAIVGVLGMIGLREVAGIELHAGNVSMILNLAIGAWGIIAGLMKK